jgi:nucleotide-binding universal stress UspA family protein
MKTILVAVDLSAATLQVCAVARDLARALGARLLILHVVPPAPVMPDYCAPSIVDDGELLRDAARRAAHRLQALGRWFRRRCPDTKILQHRGAPVTEVLRTARMARPELIVLGSHGHTAAFDLLMGSVAHGVIRRSPVPVVVVPIKERARGQDAAHRASDTLRSLAATTADALVALR